MKAVILAGGMGTRLAEETTLKPKPMVEIGGRPIIWHIMKIYESFGFNEFIVCLGYKGSQIKEYFVNYSLYNSDMTVVDVATGKLEVRNSNSETFKVTLVDTGFNTNTAGRIKKIQPLVNNETFMLTYGDGVADVNIPELIDFHKKGGKHATLTTIQMPGRFGTIKTDDNGLIKDFKEKYDGDEVWINGGFFVLEPAIFKYLEGDMENVQWEKDPLIRIANDGQLMAYRHRGFWKCMDAIRDKTELENLWDSGTAPWKVWK